jgi:hypothetical protein
MIQTKIIDLNKYKNIADLEKDLDNLANYEGYLIQNCAGKKNNLLILQRSINYPQQQFQQIPETEILPLTPSKSSSKKKVNDAQNLPEKMYPNAVYK